MSTSRIKATLSLLQKQKPRWPDPELSIGKFRGIKKGKYNCWEAEGPAKEAFEEIKPQIKLLLEELCGPVPSSSFILFDIFMIGETQSTAVPHIMFSCKHQKSRKAAVKAVEQSDVLQQCPPGIHFGHWDYPPHLKDLRFLSSSMSYSSPPRLTDASRHYYDIIPIFDPYKPQTVRAMQLRLKKTRGSSATYRTATIGSVVEFSGKRFYLAPAHVFSNNTPDLASDGPSLDSNDSDCEFGGFDELNDNTPEDHEAEFMSQYSVTPESSDVEEEWDLDDEHLSDVDSEGSSPEENGIQSAIVSDSKPAWCLPDSPETITPSSSDAVRESIKLHKLDYFLLEIDDGDKFYLDLPVLSGSSVGRPGPGAINVTAFTGSGKLLSGVLSDRRTCIRLPHTTGYTEVLSVEFQHSLHPGDSGSVVRDASTGMIYGHVVAGDTGSQTAFIIPADDMLDDLMANTGDNTTIFHHNSPQQKVQPLSTPISSRHRRPLRWTASSSHTSMAAQKSLESPDLYTVGWIAALPTERTAATALLDEEHERPRNFIQSHYHANTGTPPVNYNMITLLSEDLMTQEEQTFSFLGVNRRQHEIDDAAEWTCCWLLQDTAFVHEWNPEPECVREMLSWTSLDLDLLHAVPVASSTHSDLPILNTPRMAAVPHDVTEIIPPLGGRSYDLPDWGILLTSIPLTPPFPERYVTHGGQRPLLTLLDTSTDCVNLICSGFQLWKPGSVYGPELVVVDMESAQCNYCNHCLRRVLFICHSLGGHRRPKRYCLDVIVRKPTHPWPSAGRFDFLPPEPEPGSETQS